MSQMSYVIAQLSGVKQFIAFTYRVDAIRAVIWLANCPDHHGAHHFAVVGDGGTIAMSQAGYDCLAKAGIVPVVAP